MDVIVAGAGPTGLMLAYELRLAGLDVLAVDRAEGRDTTESRAGGIHARTMEVLDQRGLLDDFLAQGRCLQAGHFSGLRLDFSGFDTRYPFLLSLLQRRIEVLLERHVLELGVPIRWSAEVTSVSQNESGVEVVAGGETIRAKYLVGCDGGRSVVRKQAGIGFTGTDPTMTSLLGDVELAEPPADLRFMTRSDHGDYSVIPFEPGWYRVMVGQYDRVLDRDEPVTLESLRAALIKVAGTDFGMHSPRWLSKFNDSTRLAANYRSGRVFLAGDAAHIHYPAGGQGLNMGVQDAVNLGWKLAAVIRGEAPESLLDTYQTERRPVAERVLENTRAQSALSQPTPQTQALRDILASLIDLGPVNDRLGYMITALDVRYPMTGEHPLVGRRVPDQGLKTADGEVRLFSLLHGGRPVLLSLGGQVGLPDGWADRVEVVEAQCTSDWTIPLIGAVPDVSAVLIRPDGYVAWVGSAGQEGLTNALSTWFGPARG
ncbi:FAD-dependent oxidoreductase [Actinocrispum sp. NPDC049592]|uniref:FAD-dependent oxidoreductase n=1 Tax=Actinocrispum sp. NPDC049592 TaxID=3154835 RepID=UPI00341624D1